MTIKLHTLHIYQIYKGNILFSDILEYNNPYHTCPDIDECFGSIDVLEVR